jgi:hypothetical protein
MTVSADSCRVPWSPRRWGPPKNRGFVHLRLAGEVRSDDGSRLLTEWADVQNRMGRHWPWPAKSMEIAHVWSRTVCRFWQPRSRIPAACIAAMRRVPAAKPLASENITWAPFTGISRNAHLYVKTPAGPRGDASIHRVLSMARCTHIIRIGRGLHRELCIVKFTPESDADWRSEAYECRPGLRAAGSGAPAG